MKVITLPCFGISLELGESNTISKGYLDGVILTSDLKKECSHCHKVDCSGFCESAYQYLYDKDKERQKSKQEGINRRNAYNDKMDVVESMILSHAVAGVDVCSSAYIEGIVSIVTEG